MESAFIVVILIVAGIAIWLVSFYLDDERIRSDVESRGGQFLDKNWDPFAKGWFGEKGERLYRVRFQDQHGVVHDAICKTSLFTGVFWADDTPASPPRESQSVSALERENERLRAEIERLRQAKSSGPDEPR